MKLQRGQYQFLMMGLLSTMIWGCQPTTEVPAEPQAAVESQPKDLLLQVKNEKVALAQPQLCDMKECTRFDIQTLQTNVDWINVYFISRLEALEPQAFKKQDLVSLEGVNPEQLGLNQSHLHVRYLGQNQALATFVLHSYNYSAGAAHGMYHNEYINFDLNQKKRFSLKDMIKKGKKQQFAEALYHANYTWLQEHQIALDQLKLSDNFYYGSQGIVLVYPLYEMASYAEGMTELVLPYSLAKDLIQPVYLPVLPEYGTL